VEEHLHDQIAWFVSPTGSSSLTPPLRYEDIGGNFDFVPVLKGQLSTTQLSWRISDHYPLWASSRCDRHRHSTRKEVPNPSHLRVRAISGR
jgi:hypothetical protein